MFSVDQHGSAFQGGFGIVATVTALSAVSAIFLYALYNYLLPRPLPGIPYNPEAVRSLLGDVPAVMSDERGPMDWLLDQGRHHGGPICQIFLRPFCRPYVLISDFREAQDIMLRRREWDRSDYSIDLLGGQAPYHHINQKTGPVWKAHRRLLRDLMTPGFLNGVAAPNIYSSTLNLIKLWSDKERLAKGRPFSAEQDIFYASLDAVLEFSFGTSFPHRAILPQMRYVETMNPDQVMVTGPAGAVEFAGQPVHETIEATLHASVVVGELMDAPFPRLSWWIRSRSPYEAWVIRTRNQYVKEQILEAVGRLGTGMDLGDKTWVKSATDLMMQRERLFAETEGRQPVYWSPSMRDEVIGFVVAGHDTTSTTLLWGLKFLTDSQPTQHKLRHALHRAHATATAEQRMPSAYEIAHTHIPYLEAVVEEMLRVANTLPILDRQARCDTELLGHHIPKGTIVMMLNRGPSFTEPGFPIEEHLRSPSCQRDRGAREWSPDGDGMHAFYPERWLTTDDEGKDVYDSKAGPSLPFGLGTRGCFGRRLAYLELRIMVTLLVWRFRLQKCPPELSEHGAVDTLTHKPRQCYVKLESCEA